MTHNPSNALPPSQLIAGIWFTLAAAVYAFALFALIQGQPYLAISITGIASMILITGCQRTEKLRISDEKFNQLLMSLGIGLAILGSLVAITN